MRPSRTKPIVIPVFRAIKMVATYIVPNDLGLDAPFDPHLVARVSPNPPEISNGESYSWFLQGEVAGGRFAGLEMPL
jgi:hypothetical protein